VRPGGHGHWNNCPVHIAANWGESAPNVLNGVWSATATELHFSWNVNGVKKKDYWFIRKKNPTIHLLELDGSRTNGADSFYPSERTHGFGFGSNARSTGGIPLSIAMGIHNSVDFGMKVYEWSEGQVSSADSLQTKDFVSCNGRDNELWWSFSCYKSDDIGAGCMAANIHSHTQSCYDRLPNGSFTEQLRYWSDPWPQVNDRKNARWLWLACHASGTSTCYHGGSHAYPMAQVIDDNGMFYGWVGIEHQDDSGGDENDDLLVIRYVRQDLIVMRP
jgi:hypothetical protein